MADEKDQRQKMTEDEEKKDLEGLKMDQHRWKNVFSRDMVDDDDRNLIVSREFWLVSLFLLHSQEKQMMISKANEYYSMYSDHSSIYPRE